MSRLKISEEWNSGPKSTISEAWRPTSARLPKKATSAACRNVKLQIKSICEENFWNLTIPSFFPHFSRWIDFIPTYLLFTRATISSKDGTVLKICELSVEPPSPNFPALATIGAERSSPVAESGRKTLMYSKATTATAAETWQQQHIQNLPPKLRLIYVRTIRLVPEREMDWNLERQRGGEEASGEIPADKGSGCDSREDPKCRSPSSLRNIVCLLVEIESPQLIKSFFENFLGNFPEIYAQLLRSVALWSYPWSWHLKMRDGGKVKWNGR